MVTPQAIKDDFLNDLNDARILYRHCLGTREIHTEPGVEAAFLKIQTAWEVFLEEIFLSFLCGSQPLSGDMVVPYFTVNDVEIARKILYQEKAYCDWTDIDNVVMRRIKAFFLSPNRIEQALSTVKGDLQDILNIRNHIAHSSKKSKDRFAKICIKKLGGNPNLHRAADLLLMSDNKNPQDTYFDTYTYILETIAIEIAG